MYPYNLESEHHFTVTLGCSSSNDGPFLAANVRTTNDEDRPWSQENGTYAAWNLYYVNESDITQGLLGFVNLAVVCAWFMRQITRYSSSDWFSAQDSTATDQDGV